MTNETSCADPRVDIQQVLYAYCRSMDRMDAELTLACFTRDAELSYNGLFQGPPADFVKWLWPLHAALIGHSHQLANVLVEVSGDSAVSEAYVTVTLRAAGNGQLADLIGKGRYLDNWRRSDGRWRIVRRRYVSDLTSVVPAGGMDLFPGRLTAATANPPRLVSTRDEHDPSFLLSTWRPG